MGSIVQSNNIFLLGHLARALSLEMLRYATLLAIGLAAAPSLAQFPTPQAKSSSASSSVLTYGEPLPYLGSTASPAASSSADSSLTTTAEMASETIFVGVSQSMASATLVPFSIQLTSLGVGENLHAQVGARSDTTARPTFVPRAFARYTHRGAGYLEGFTSLGAFVPFDLDSNLGLTFFEGQLLIQNNSALGANAVLGHRFYDRTLEAVYG
ncbi:MAG: hypothetical protein NZ772_14650, partial [Cyanobacteria bacterium]|nr:hypothetical protein [Cyanobacteriota bacterium]MDW8202614.1 hypothetical protein [Cyanobacteriota bacterium SKYGB_h_bin112]